MASDSAIPRVGASLLTKPARGMPRGSFFLARGAVLCGFGRRIRLFSGWFWAGELCLDPGMFPCRYSRPQSTDITLAPRCWLVGFAILAKPFGDTYGECAVGAQVLDRFVKAGRQSTLPLSAFASDSRTRCFAEEQTPGCFFPARRDFDRSLRLRSRLLSASIFSCQRTMRT